MNSIRVNTTNDLLQAIADAMMERDLPAFDLAEKIVRDWLISEEEREALLNLIEAASMATDELVSSIDALRLEEGA